jgi:hypothetical protein
MCGLTNLLPSANQMSNNVESLTSHNPIGLHDVLTQFYIHLQLICSSLHWAKILSENNFLIVY